MVTPNADHYAAIARKLTLPSQAYIDGAFCHAADVAVFDNLNPATGAVIGQVAHCGAVDVDRAVRSARDAFESGA